MKLSRRDAILVAVGSGLATGTASVATEVPPLDRQRRRGGTGGTPRTGDGVLSDEKMEILVSLAEVLYPDEVDVTEEFVGSYVGMQTAEKGRGIEAAIAALDGRARRWAGRGFAALPEAKREALLREAGIDRVQPDREGTAAQRIRYHLVNGLLYALFTHPKGSELVGIENPRGYPGGFETITKPGRDP